METSSLIQRIADRLREMESPDRVREGLQELLNATDSRAVGLWHMENRFLKLIGFVAKPDMPEEVRQGFANATRNVPINKPGFGIVQAIMDRAPAMAYVEKSRQKLPDSTSWLAKFDAVQSLAVPIFRGEEISGALAVSAGHAFSEGDEVWHLATGIAERLSH